MSNRYLILDCFVDEPACLGVPPFISPYPRYIYGALVDAGVPASKIKYHTIDYLRDNDYALHESFEIIFLIGGAIVPGKYLGSRIGTTSEITRLIKKNSNCQFAAGGLISHMPGFGHDNVIPVSRDIEKFAYHYAKGTHEDEMRTVEEIGRWSKYGAAVVRQHPGFPNVICEIETSRGCPRKKHCSFCSEGLFENIQFREESDIIYEIEELIKNGVSRFRLGRQADLLQYKTKFTRFRNEFPKPEISPIKNLFSELKKKRVNGEISTLNVDNANPGTIVNFPDESSLILESIVDSITPGDTLALGIESFDPEVIEKNNLKVTGEEAVNSIKIINRIGGKRIDGIPVLLPGINLIHGLTGESVNTFKENYKWLLDIRDMGLLLKRINIRKLLPFPGTGIYNKIPAISGKMRNRFEYFRSKIRNDIDNYMLKQVYPAGTLLKDCQILDVHTGYSYGKQIASYSITAKYPLQLNINNFYDSIIIGHRERSVIALPYPLDVNTLPPKAFELIPGIGRKKATEIILNRPYRCHAELEKVLAGTDKNGAGKFFETAVYRSKEG